MEEQKARRQTYSACATALLARRDAAVAFLETFPEDSFDPAAAQALLQNLDEQRDGVARAVGAVAIEGPDAVAKDAEYAAVVIEALAGRLRDWVASVVSRSTASPPSAARCCTPPRAGDRRAGGCGCGGDRGRGSASPSIRLTGGGSASLARASKGAASLLEPEH